MPRLIGSEDVVAYLAGQGLAPDLDAHVLSVRHRNRSFHVRISGSLGVALKQGIGPTGTTGLAGEASVYEYLWKADPGGAAHVLPRLVLYDRTNDILVTELVTPSEDLDTYQRRIGRLPKDVGASLGKALAWLHNQPVPDDRRTAAACVPPWVLRVHRPDIQELIHLSAAQLELIKVVQSLPELCEDLDRMAERWQCRTFIHNDVKWSNVRVVHRSRGEHSQLRLVDWETATLGDPAWDVGAAMAAYLAAWIFSIPFVPGRALDDVASLARWPIEDGWPAIRELWRAYTRDAEIEPSDLDALLSVVRFAGVRLLQTAYEQSKRSWHLDPDAAALVQVSANVLSRTEDAAHHLLGVA